MAFGYKSGGGSRKNRPNERTRERYNTTAPYVPLALGVIVGLARSAESETTRLEAAKELLNRCWGKPTRQDAGRVTVNNTQVNNYGEGGIAAPVAPYDAWRMICADRTLIVDPVTLESVR